MATLPLDGYLTLRNIQDLVKLDLPQVKSDPSETTAAVCARPHAISIHLRFSPSLQVNSLGGRRLGILKWRSLPLRAVWPLWLYPHVYIALLVGTPTTRKLQITSSISIAVCSSNAKQQTKWQSDEDESIQVADEAVQLQVSNFEQHFSYPAQEASKFTSPFRCSLTKQFNWTICNHWSGRQ